MGICRGLTIRWLILRNRLYNEHKILNMSIGKGYNKTRRLFFACNGVDEYENVPYEQIEKDAVRMSELFHDVPV